MNTQTIRKPCGATTAAARKKTPLILIEPNQPKPIEQPILRNEVEENEKDLYWWQKGQYA